MGISVADACTSDGWGLEAEGGMALKVSGGRAARGGPRPCCALRAPVIVTLVVAAAALRRCEL